MPITLDGVATEGIALVESLTVGKGNDLSLLTAMPMTGQNNELIDALLTSPATRALYKPTMVDVVPQFKQVREYTDDTGKLVRKIVVGGRIWTEVPEVSDDACCWTTPGMAGCLTTTDLNYLCIKDCKDIIESVWEDMTSRGPADATAPFGGSNETQERRNQVLTWFKWFVYRNMVLGTPDVSGNNLKPFHGLLEFMESDYVLSINGASLLAAMEQVRCQLKHLQGNWVIGAHPLVADDVQQAVTASGLNIRVLRQDFLPVDPETGKTELVLVSLESMGAILSHRIDNPMYRHQIIPSTDPTQGCMVECDTYGLMGGLFLRDFNGLIKITDVDLTGSCGPNAFYGMQGQINPETLMPDYA